MYTPAKPGGRQPWFAQGMHTTKGLRWPSSNPMRLTALSVETDLLQAAQVVVSALFSFAFSLGIADALRFAVRSQSPNRLRALAPNSLCR